MKRDSEVTAYIRGRAPFAHCALWFRDGNSVVGAKPGDGMGHFGRITSLDDLPPAMTLTAHVRKATRLIDEKAAPGRAAPRAGRRRTRA